MIPQKGTVLLIHGRTGCGKTVIYDLLLSMYKHMNVNCECVSISELVTKHKIEKLFETLVNLQTEVVFDETQFGDTLFFVKSKAKDRQLKQYFKEKLAETGISLLLTAQQPWPDFADYSLEFPDKTFCQWPFDLFVHICRAKDLFYRSAQEKTS